MISKIATAVMIVMTVLLCAFISAYSGMTSQQSPQNVTITSSPDAMGEYQVLSDVERLNELDMGSVVVKRVSDGMRIKAIVSPTRKLEIGETVKLVSISWINADFQGSSTGGQMHFLAVK